VADFLAVLPVVDVVTMMPVSVSGLGVRETVLEELLGQVAGVPGDAAVAVSLVGFGFTLFWVVAGGLAVQLGFLSARNPAGPPAPSRRASPAREGSQTPAVPAARPSEARSTSAADRRPEDPRQEE
jgi:hypothetical protein